MAGAPVVAGRCQRRMALGQRYPPVLVVAHVLLKNVSLALITHQATHIDWSLLYIKTRFSLHPIERVGHVVRAQQVTPRL